MEIGALPEYWPVLFPTAHRVDMGVTPDQRAQGIEPAEGLRATMVGGALDGQVCLMLRVHVDDSDLAAIESARGFWVRFFGAAMAPTDFLLEMHRHEGVTEAQSACPTCLSPVTADEWRRRRMASITPADEQLEEQEQTG